MPEQLDPEWEYYVPNPEILEVAFSAVPNRFEGAFPLEEDSLGNYSNNLGCRYGKGGNPDKFWNFKLAPRKTIYEKDRLYDKPKNCLHCSKLYIPYRQTSKYCSHQCRGRAQKLLPRTWNCRRCNKEFIPLREGAAYCSRLCAGLDGSDLIRKPKEFRRCILCNIEFVVKKKKNVKYCSSKCALSCNKGIRLLPDYICANPECSKSFRPRKATIVACSRKCGYRVKSLRAQGIVS